MKDKPHLIYNIDEKGINTEYKPPNIVAGRGYQPQTVMAEKSKTVTIIGAGNALGNQIPPFFVFPGKRMMPELFNGKSVGTDGLLTPSGWSNSEVFRIYMKNHFLKYVQGRNPSDTILALYDGHRSHISLDLIDWAKNNNIVLFVLPPHCSHILQPLDVGCFGPFQLKYNQECLSFSRQTHKTVTRFDVCSLACKAYISALSPSNIQSAFSKSGIYPFQSAETMLQNLKQQINPSILYDKGDGDKDSLCDNYEAVEKHTADCTGDNSINEAKENDVGDFFMKRGGEVNKKIEVVKKKKRNSSHVIGGKAVTEDDILERMKNNVSESSRKSNISSNYEIGVTKSQKRKKNNQTQNINKENQAGPSTSDPGLASSEKYVAPLIDSSEDENDEGMAEKDKCCVCKRFYVNSRNIYEVAIVRWAKCETCGHWVHLRYCTPTRVVRRNTPFKCRCCEN